MGNPNREIQLFEAEERWGSLLSSQKAFVSAGPVNSTQIMKIAVGGFGCGKSFICIVNGLILSALYPGNQGQILRKHGRDLEESIIPDFFKLCPESWIKRNGFNKALRIVTLRNGSQISFRHLHDPNARTTKSRRTGSNLGWFFISQLEECDVEHWNGMLGRLRNPRAKIRMALADANPNGRDWIQKLFFPNIRPFNPGEFFQYHRNGNLVGLAVRSDENRKSNGGFVDDAYYDTLKTLYPANWYARYVQCSFDDFSGKILVGYTKDSVHNIEPFEIPPNWNLIVPIDVGGDCPWAVTPMYVDTYGNIIVTDGFHKATGRTAEVAGWIRTNLPWNESRTQYWIDPENKIAMVELAEMGVHCQVAMKSVLPGVLRMAQHFYIDPLRGLPGWYFDTQPKDRVEKFKLSGSPRIFVFKTETTVRDEADTWIWDGKKRNEPLKTNEKRFDCMDAIRYGLMTRPLISSLPKVSIYNRPLIEVDEVSKREWERYDKKIALHMSLKNGTNLREAEMDEISSTQEHFAALMDGEGRYDWN